MRGHKGCKKVSLYFIATAIFIAVAFPRVYASGEIPILQSDVYEDSVVLYLGGAAGGQKAEAQIGTEVVGSVELRELDGSTPIITWVLVDNSLSIAATDRERTGQLITDIAAGRLPNERITLCTISDRLNIITRESQNYTELKAQIDGIQYADQETYLTDVLDELLNDEAQRKEPAYVRCVVISDGVDNNPGGITREELSQRLSEKNIPIYSIGCVGEDSALKAMYALSRQTGAKSWVMGEISDTLSIVSALGSDEVPLRAEITIPEALRDGTSKGVRLTLDDGGTATTQLTMPFGTITETPPTPEPTPEPAIDEEEEEPDDEEDPDDERSIFDNIPIIVPIIVGGIVVLAGIAVLIIFLMKRNKNKNRVRTISEGPVNNFRNMSSGTEILDGDQGDSRDTLILVGNDRTFMLSLTDISQPERHFEAPLRNKVTIGRSPSNQIVVDYDNSVSGTHCEILVAGNMLKIHDLNSRNGTFVDGTQVVDTAEIINGSTIKMGRVVFRVGIQ